MDFTQNSPSGSGAGKTDADIYDPGLEEDGAKLRFSLTELKKKLDEKDVRLEQLGSVLVIKEKIIEQKDSELYALRSSRSPDTAQAAAVVGEETIRRAVAVCKTALTAKNNEISALKDALNRLTADISALREENKRLESRTAAVPRKSSGPDMKIIESIYLRAFESVGNIARDAKDGINGMTNRAFLELNSDINRAADLNKSLIESKNDFAEFIRQGKEQLRSLETLLEAIPQMNIDTPEHIRSLSLSRDKILSDVETAVGAFDRAVDSGFDTVDTAPAAEAPSVPAVIPGVHADAIPAMAAPARPEIAPDFDEIKETIKRSLSYY